MGRGGVRRPLGPVLAESPRIGNRDSIPYSGNLFGPVGFVVRYQS